MLRNFQKTLVTLAMPALLLVPAGTRAEVELFQDLTLDQALARAAAEKKMVLVDYFTTWCVPCKQMDATTWVDPKVIDWVEEYAIAVRFNAEVEVEQAKTHDIGTFPTTLLLRADGHEMDRLTGFKTTEELISEITDGLEGKDAVARAHEKWQADPHRLALRMTYGKALADKGLFEEALKEYLACWDAPLDEDPTFGGVRGSFLLGNFFALAKRYPPARDALEGRRKTLELDILRGALEKDEQNAAGALFGYQALSERLDGDGQRILDLFGKVETQGDRLAMTHRAMIQAFGRPLLAARRYDLLLRGEEPEALFDAQVERLVKSQDSLGDSKAGPMREETSKAIRQFVVQRGLDGVEILLGTGQRDRGLALADRVAEFEDSPDTWTQLAERARRAGDDDTANQLAGRVEAETTAGDGSSTVSE